MGSTFHRMKFHFLNYICRRLENTEPKAILKILRWENVVYKTESYICNDNPVFNSIVEETVELKRL